MRIYIGLQQWPIYDCLGGGKGAERFDCSEPFVGGGVWEINLKEINSGLHKPPLHYINFNRPCLGLFIFDSSTYKSILLILLSYTNQYRNSQ